VTLLCFVCQLVDILNIVVTLALVVEPGLAPASVNAASPHLAGIGSVNNLSTINNGSSHLSRKLVPHHSSKWLKSMTFYK